MDAWRIEGELAALRERDEARAALDEALTRLLMVPEGGVSGTYYVEARDMWTAIVEQATDDAEAARKERDEARADEAAWCRRYTERGTEIDALRAQLAARDARIAELDSLLAQRPASAPDVPKSTPDAFREFGGDRRRVGG